MTIFKLWNVLPLIFFHFFRIVMTEKTEYTFFLLYFDALRHEAVNIIIVKRSVTTETSYDIVHRYTS